MHNASFFRISLFIFLVVFCLFSTLTFAATAREIDITVDEALQRFSKEVPGAADVIAKSKGVLVFPKVYKGGIGLGAEYGVGALRIQNKTKEYYNTMAGSFGFQLGGQVKTVYLFFMNDQALSKFRNSDGWKAGVDGSVALLSIGADGRIDTLQTDQPILGFVLNQKGLMYNLTLEGSKFNKIIPD